MFTDGNKCGGTWQNYFDRGQKPHQDQETQVEELVSSNRIILVEQDFALSFAKKVGFYKIC
jgi:abortive infection bacteriophage resistance protein